MCLKDGGRIARCVAGAMLSSGQVLLVRRSPQRRRYPDVWDLFGGHVEAGESLEEALRPYDKQTSVQVGSRGRALRGLPVQGVALDLGAVPGALRFEERIASKPS